MDMKAPGGRLLYRFVWIDGIQVDVGNERDSISVMIYQI